MSKIVNFYNVYVFFSEIIQNIPISRKFMNPTCFMEDWLDGGVWIKWTKRKARGQKEIWDFPYYNRFLKEGPYLTEMRSSSKIGIDDGGTLSG
ncbi:hypothetical protein CEXT_627391 [Caerostris extrusa]|uniref:Uncharacterized protein n=1 Tax=Caerostris extrusa TaxID=172846 RepID=A0AAV4Y6C2_CAEEX|nr:hypothetical protein CEXT_627391 [Caerostris extrusa]